ncbi:MAG TPA: DMT family transporter [Xanthobacteraceae bacterium]|nr:DMT family transporter [Xanthobacteraceae bacterium]
MNSSASGAANKQSAGEQSDVGARVMLVVLCLVWGSTWPVLKIALTEVPPLTLRTLSAAIGAVTLFLICRVMGRSLRIPSAKSALHIVVASLLNIVAFTVLSSFAQLSTATGRVAILAYTMPIWAILFAWLFLGERPRRVQLVAFILCIVGLSILIYPLMAHGVPLGLFLALAVGVCWGAGTVYMKWAHIDADPMGVACWQMIVAFVIITLWMFGYDGRLNFDHADIKGYFAFAWSGVIGNGVAYALWFTIVKRLPAMTASLGVIGTPVVGVISSIIILGERPTLPDIIGFALIFSASACALLTRQRTTEEMEVTS